MTAPHAAAHKVELLTCITPEDAPHRKGEDESKERMYCISRRVSLPASLASSTSVHATLTRHGRVYATGALHRLGTREQLVLKEPRRLAPGTYTLSLRRRAHGRWGTARQLIRVA